MKSAKVYYRKNKTDECFYRVIPDNRTVEVVFTFDDCYKSIEEIQCNQTFILQLIEDLEEIDRYTYECVKNYVACMTKYNPKRVADPLSLQPAGSNM